MPSVERLTVGRWRTNCWKIAVPDVAILVDPGADEESINQWLDEGGFSPDHILLTHGHHDHLGAAAGLQSRFGSPVWLHPSDLGLARSANVFLRHFDRASKPISIPEVFLAVGLETEAFAAAGVHSMHTPGHSPGSVSYVLPELGIVLTGDALFAQQSGRTDLPGGDESLMTESLRSLLQNPDIPGEWQVLPGHGRTASVGDARRALMHNRKEINGGT